MKCPKNFDKVIHQPTLTDMWFGKKIYSEVKTESDFSEYSPEKKYENLRKTCPLNSTTHSDVETSATNEITDIENNSDDNDIIKSSQDTHKSKLRNKIDKTLAKISKTPQLTPHKSRNPKLFGSPNKKLSSSEVYEVSSNVIKKEIVELLDDMKDFESIEMNHNLSDILVNSTSPNILDCTELINHPVEIESFIKGDTNAENDQLKDSLQIDEKMMEHEKPKIITKLKSIMIDKKISKTKLKDIIPVPKKSSDVKKFHDLMDKSKSRKNLNLQNNNRETMKLKTHVLSTKLLKVLKTFNVQLQHEVPPQHMIETSAGARTLNPEQIASFQNYGPLKRGPYSKEEDDVIKKNWETFCDVHNWDKNIVEPFLYMRHEGKYYIPVLEERKNFVRFLANGLPWRSLYSVHYRFRNMFNTSVYNGPYTLKEDKKILSYMSKASSVEDNKCAELAKLLNRKRQSIWTRYQKLKKNYNLSDTPDKKQKIKKQSRRKKKEAMSNKINLYSIPKIFTDIKWTCPLVKKFIDSILEITACNDLMNLKNQQIDTIVWRKLEKKMCIDSIVLQNFWYLQLHMQLFCPTPIYLNDIKVKLIEHIYTKQLDYPEEINWESISAHFNGITPHFLSKLFEQLFNCARKNITVSNLSDALEYLYKNYVPMLIEKSIDAILPKLFYHKGKIICIDKGSEKKIPNKFTTDPFYNEDET
ncbi:uncharacterized protein LOC131670573 isoform X2 [Phymastichus coffea]|nr:uncharacterized protein LOC131670573 isoform X2 [Phymastichus coffea]XP_058802265.1 uncharacterized protein LOC131670573 isoform X2 [Phymastichus coffea]